MKYGIWNIRQPLPDAVNTLVAGGFAPLTAMVLAARGYNDPKKVTQILDCPGPLPDPYCLRDMDRAVERVRLALCRKEKIAVFGDYDVDGITATCLLTEFLRKEGANCIPYIPGRLEEGYGLNPIAIHQLHSEGVKLIITVDCGITAIEEASLCHQLGIDLVITDHHECKDTLPEAEAVVNPHRTDCSYPHKDLSGVGVAFKLAAALCGSQEAALANYADLVCLGTVADVMPLRGENRVFVTKGLDALRNSHRPGVLALMKEAGCEKEHLSASSVGYSIAPRINAAGRMGQIDLAVGLFLTRDPARAEAFAKALCELNRERQAVESEIYQQAAEMLPKGQLPDAIVLAEESWHQGVVGIVASRIAEEYCCPAFLICLDGEHGKASSRSYGGFNLFSSLTSLSHLLESYGGHELAAGFTIRRQNIAPFREAICRLAGEFYSDDTPRTVLDVDCAVGPEMLTVANVDSLERLEPCGSGCPKPVLVLRDAVIDSILQVGNGRHMRLRLHAGRHMIQGIWFSANAKSASIAPGDTVDIAFIPQINEYRGERSVQMNIQDIRPSCKAECSVDVAGYRAFCNNTITPAKASALLPDRDTLVQVWKYLAAIPGGYIEEAPVCLCRKIVRWTQLPLCLGTMMVCLDIFADVGLIEFTREHKNLTIRLLPAEGKTDLNASRTMQRLCALKESE